MLTVRPVFAIPVQGEHERLAERTLAVARAFVAASAVVAVSIGRLAPVPNATPTYTVLGGYILFACVAVLCLHFTPGRWPVPAAAMHAVDVAVAAAITVCTSDVNGPFFVLFLFTLLAAAYRWGFAATLLTASAGILVLLVDTAYQSVFNASFAGGVESDRLIMRSGGLLLAGALTGYLAQSEQRLRSELTTIAAILSRADIRTGLKRTMAFVFDAVIRLFDARRMLLVIHEVATERVFVWDGARSADGSVQALQASRLDLNDLPAYLFEPRAAAWHAVRRSGARQDAFDVLALDSAGSRLKTQAWDLPPAFLEAVPRFERLMAVGVEAGTEWSGRVFFFDPVIGANRPGVLRFARRLVQQLAPAVQNVYLLHRLRSTASALERGRIACELHDGVIQSVMGVELQVAALSRRLGHESPAAVAELTRLDAILRQEVVTLRELMEQMKPLELDPEQLVDALGGFVQRFQRETGIAARFITQLDRVALAPHACREIARILNEALINVRRHSGARNVFVRLATVNGDCRLSIDDDGCGFPFRGRLSQADLERSRRGPLVIKQRVRMLGGQLTIESDPGRGARLEIAVPLSGQAIHG